MKVIEGKVVSGSAGKIKVGIVAARFNEFIVSKLVAGAKDGLVRHDVEDDDITLCWVPGAFEIPVAAKKMAESKRSRKTEGTAKIKKTGRQRAGKEGKKTFRGPAEKTEFPQKNNQR